MRAGRNPGILVPAVFLALMVGCASTPPRRMARELPFPAPFAGPGVPAASVPVMDAVRKGWVELRAGNPDGALDASRRAGAHPLASLLAYDVALAEGAAGLVEPLEELARTHPEWAAAWVSLSFAAEREGQDDTALEAARRAARLWPQPRWKDRLARLRWRAVGAPMAEAAKALEDGDAARALELARSVERTEPDNARARLIEARALIALDRRDEASTLLKTMHDVPEAVALAARLAEERGDWTAALSLYQELPPTWPGRAGSLARVKLMWRMENMPAFVRAALESPSLTRAQMAAILVALVPEIEALQGGPAPLMTDIVGLPEQREILAVVRAGIMRPRGPQASFRPEAPLKAAETAAILGRLAQRLGRTLPPACGGTPDPGCLHLGEPVTGAMVKNAVWAMLFPGGAQ